MGVVPLPVDGQSVVGGGGAGQRDELHGKYRGGLQRVQPEVGGPGPSDRTQSGYYDQPGPLSLVEECRGSSLIGRELPQ